RGNVFSGPVSATGGSSDTQNNVESVFVPAGVTGPFSVTVTATNIAGVGVPNNASAPDQDFALVIYNGNDCVLTCPANIIVNSDPNKCGAVVTSPAPTFTGTCGTITCTPASGSFFAVGTTTVTCTPATGATCSFTVTVKDVQPPSISCPASIATCSGGVGL